MQKFDKPYISHILDAVILIEEYVKNLDREKFLDEKNKMTQDAVVREFEIIGEAVRRLSDEIKKKDPSLPWRDIADMRNKLAHEYFAIDLGVVWGVIKKDLPILKKTMLELLDSLK